jgi:hypothetical protein
MVVFMDRYGHEVFGDEYKWRNKLNMSKLILSATVRFMDWFVAEGSTKPLEGGLGELIGNGKNYETF